MLVRTVLCLSTWIVLQVRSLCPLYTCANLPSNICAQYMGDSHFQLNYNHCLQGHWCSALSTREWAETFTANPGLTLNSTYYCSPTVVDLAGTIRSQFRGYDCGSKKPGQTFKSGQIVNSCTTDTDCELSDGSFSECMCVFKSDGTGVCTATKDNDQVFPEFWDECGDSNYIDSLKAAYFWVFYLYFWEYTKSTVPCVHVFMEIGDLNDLYVDYIGAGALGIGVISVLVG